MKFSLFYYAAAIAYTTLKTEAIPLNSMNGMKDRVRRRKNGTKSGSRSGRHSNRALSSKGYSESRSKGKGYSNTSVPRMTDSPTDAPTDVCRDDPSFTFKKNRNSPRTTRCAYLTQGNVEVRLEKFCSRWIVRTNCPQSCGGCIDVDGDEPTLTPTDVEETTRAPMIAPSPEPSSECRDNPNFTFRKNSSSARTTRCQYLTQGNVALRVDKFCGRDTVRFNCLEACGLCEIVPFFPTESPTPDPSASMTSEPTLEPTTLASFSPSSPPTMITSEPSDSPTSKPSTMPTVIPSNKPSVSPSSSPTSSPTSKPSTMPTVIPSNKPSVSPSSSPTSSPTAEITNTVA